jgi:hypothetical protein
MVLWVAELDGRPFAFAQDYACHAWALTVSPICRSDHAASICISVSRTR